MKRTLLFLAVCSLPLSATTQTFADFLDYFSGISNPVVQQQKVDSLMAEIAAFPLIEGDTTAIFLYQDDQAASVGVAGDFNGWDPGNGPLTQAGSTDLFYRSYIFEPNARLDYKFVVGSNWILDPLNPNTVLGGFGPNSELAMPDYVQPWEIVYDPDIPHGQVETFQFTSQILGQSHQVQVYLPPSYQSATNRSYPSAYFQDGQEYLSLADADHTLDNLIANGDISELIGVFVRPNDRNSEYAGAERVQYRQFFVEELVPYIDANYRTVDDPARRAVLGASFGGNISALISFDHPDLFGLCGLHSGAFWPNSYETNGVVLDGPAKEIRVASVWGSYEGSLSGNMTMVGDELLLQGYDLYSNEYPEGHSWGLWRATLDELLIFFFPPGLTPAPEIVPTASSLVLFPNPARERVTLDRTSFQGEVVLLNAFGQEVLRTELQGPELELPPRLAPGLYWLLIAEEGRQRAVGRLAIE